MNKIKKILIICTCLVLAICQIKTRVYAVTYTEGSYDKGIYNDFLSGKEKLAPKAAIVYKVLINAGATHTGACAMLGNIHKESHFNPLDHNDDFGGHDGIVQWSTHSRYATLKKLYPNTYKTIESQSEYIVYEFNHVEKYKSTWKKIIKAKPEDLIDTTEAIRINYEVCGDPKVPNKKRIEYAIDWYNYFLNSKISAESSANRTIVNSMYLEDAKNALEFKYGIPSSYNIKINSKDLSDTIDIPSIRVSIEDVLYSHGQLVSMNFLGENTQTNNSSSKTESSIIKKFWSFYRDSVRSLLRALLYISAASLLTLLIYIGLIVVKNAIFYENEIPKPGEVFKSPIKGKFGRKLLDTFNPKDERKEKDLIQEWIKSTFLIALIVLIINLISGFSTVLTDLIKGFETEEKTILVYVQGNGDDVQDFYFNTKLEGYCLFMSQFNWTKFGIKNYAFILTGFLIGVLKFILYILLFARMILAGAFIAISPIIILINSFKKVSGEERPTTLKNWIKFFMFLALFRPVLGIVYYAIFNSNPYSFAKDPAFIIILYVIFGLVIYAYIRFAFWLDVDKIGKKVRK